MNKVEQMEKTKQMEKAEEKEITKLREMLHRANIYLTETRDLLPISKDNKVTEIICFQSEIRKALEAPYPKCY